MPTRSRWEARLRHRTHPIVLPASLVLLAALWVGGCKQGASSRTDGLGGGVLPTVPDPDRLSLDLLRLIDQSTAEAIGLATTIARETKDPAVRERTLRAKLALVTAAEMVVREPDPRRAFVLAWVLNEQWRQNAESQAQEADRPEWYRSVKEFNRKERESLLAIGRRHFGEEWIVRMTPEVESYAAVHPVTEHLVDRYQLRQPEKSGRSTSPIEDIIAVPFSPFSGLQGVGDTPEAIRGFTLVAAQFGETVHQLPMRLRWEMELLLFELESLETVQRSVESLERATVALESFSKSAETLPADLRKEVDALIASTTEAQEPLRETLAKAEETSASLRQTVEAFQASLQEVKPLAASVTEAGEAWGRTAESVGATLTVYERIAGGGEEAEDARGAGEAGKDEGSDDIERITALAQEFRLASEDLRLLLADLDAGRLDQALARTGASVDRSVDHASDRFGALATAFAIRAVCVLAAGFVLLLAYRYLAARVRPAGR